MARKVLYSPSGSKIEVYEERAEFLKSKGWTENEKSSKSVSKKTKNSEE